MKIELKIDDAVVFSNETEPVAAEVVAPVAEVPAEPVAEAPADATS